MAPEEEQPDNEALANEELPAAYPPDWPGIQGRSSESEGEPERRGRSDEDAGDHSSGVTEAQRHLEREVQEPETP